MYKLIVIVALMIVSCGGEHLSLSRDMSADDFQMSVESYDYLDSALRVMESNSIRRDSINWAKLRHSSMMAARGAQSISDTYPAIQLALANLGDNHSFFLSPQALKDAFDLGFSDNTMPVTDWIDGRYGYIRMYGFTAGDNQEQIQYALYLRNLIRQLNSKHPCGWVIDLRDNTGGALWPMLAGLAPLLGDGCVGMFRGLNHAHESWIVDGDRVLLDTIATIVVPDPGPQGHSSVPVAVLTGKSTGSAAEGVAVAFRGRENSQSFGESTAGVPSGVSVFFLPDSAGLALATAWFVDRTGQVYDAEIQPDSPVSYLSDYVYENSSEDPVIRAAMEWLSDRESCRKELTSSQR